MPVTGAQVLFSVWDTRVQDFETFVKSTGYDATAGMYSNVGWEQRGATWKEPGFSQGANHPVVGVSWNDAEEFCKWLTKRERGSGDLPEDREYRLPKDEEWSAAIGLKNEAGSTPEEKSGKIKLYPWDIPQKRDKSWPPPTGAGNYAGEEAKIGDWPSVFKVIEGYHDGYPRTSPVGALRRILTVCTTWEATYSNGAKIGTMLARTTVCCAVGRGVIPSPICCLLRVAASNSLVFESIVLGFVVL